jgi:DNA helicase-2/ATP-dependent DNA helicase PcrA
MRAIGVRAAGTAPLQTLVESPPRVPEAAQESLRRLRETLADCLASGGTLPPSAEIARIRRFFEPIFQERYGSPQARLQDIEQLEQVAGAHTARGRFLSELALDPPTSTSDLAGPPLLDEDYLILSTVHSAKGGEWDVVHVIHAADGMIPSDMSTGDKEAIEEERRLFYVALTRARDNLYVYFALRFYRRPRGLDDVHSFAQLSRFLPEAVQSLFERRTAGVTTDLATTSAAQPVKLAQVDALLAALWEG